MFVTTSVTTLGQTSCRFGWWCFGWPSQVNQHFTPGCGTGQFQLHTMSLRCSYLQQCRATKCETSSPHDARMMLLAKQLYDGSSVKSLVRECKVCRVLRCRDALIFPKPIYLSKDGQRLCSVEERKWAFARTQRELCFGQVDPTRG